VLEWGTGSSTQWTLMHVGHLTSIEHDTEWAPAVKVQVTKTFGEDFLKSRWDTHVVPRGEPTGNFGPTQDPDSFW